MVLFDAGGRVLLIRRAKPPRQGEWSLPGGRQELGETVEATARRELLEETGCTAGALRLIEVVDSIVHDDSGRVRFHYTLVDFCGLHAGGVPRAESDALDITWAPIDTLAARRLWAPTLEVIARGAELLGIAGLVRRGRGPQA